MSDQQTKDISRKFELQVTKCDAKWGAVERSLKENNDRLGEILHILRGEGPNAGLLGKVNENTQRLDSVSRVFRAMWTIIVGTVVAVISTLLRGK